MNKRRVIRYLFLTMFMVILISFTSQVLIHFDQVFWAITIQNAGGIVFSIWGIYFVVKLKAW